MKRLIFPLFLAAACAAQPLSAHEGHGQAVHGGTVAEAGQAQFEIVAEGGRITVHASNHGAPLATAGASGKLTVLSGTKKQEIALQASGQDLLQGDGQLVAGDKLLLQDSWPGQKPLLARAVVR